MKGESVEQKRRIHPYHGMVFPEFHLPMRKRVATGFGYLLSKTPTSWK